MWYNCFEIGWLWTECHSHSDWDSCKINLYSSLERRRPERWLSVYSRCCPRIAAKVVGLNQYFFSLWFFGGDVVHWWSEYHVPCRWHKWNSSVCAFLNWWWWLNRQHATVIGMRLLKGQCDNSYVGLEMRKEKYKEGPFLQKPCKWEESIGVLVCM